MAVRERAGTRVRPRRDCLRRAREPGWYPRHWRRTLPDAFIGKHEARARLGGCAKGQTGYGHPHRPGDQVLEGHETTDCPGRVPVTVVPRNGDTVIDLTPDAPPARRLPALAVFTMFVAGAAGCARNVGQSRYDS